MEKKERIYSTFLYIIKMSSIDSGRFEASFLLFKYHTNRFSGEVENTQKILIEHIYHRNHFPQKQLCLNM